MNHRNEDVPTALSRVFGSPTRSKTLVDGSSAYAWTLDPSAEGVVIARSAAPDPDGRLLLQQVDWLLAAASLRGLRIRTVIGAHGVRGNRRFHERPDLLIAEEEIAAGCRWLGVLGRDRISRDTAAWFAFADYLRETKTRLYLAGSNEMIAPAHLGERIIPAETWTAVQTALGVNRARKNDARRGPSEQ